MDLISFLLLLAGFSLIVLVHELGHFLAAKYVGISVEQFALGFGQALFSYRPGLGLRLGSSEKEYQQRAADHIAKKQEAELKLKEKTGVTAEQLANAARELGLSETEYRFNWIPLGGYVKMMGQDDTKPGLVINDPRSYTSKTVGQRMLVISAGVIMNIIFAFIAFMVLFLIGMRVPPAVAGNVVPMSPAQQAVDENGKPAPIRTGDTFLVVDGWTQHDFGKLQLATALAGKGETLKCTIRRVDGKVETVFVKPQQAGFGGMKLLQIGVSPIAALQGPDLSSKGLAKEYAGEPESAKTVRPGEKIVQVEGQAVSVDDYARLDAAVQAAGGKDISVTVEDAAGKRREVKLECDLLPVFGDRPLNFAGMRTRVKVVKLTSPSSVEGKLKPDDVITEITVNGDVRRDPTHDELVGRIQKAAKDGQAIRLKVEREGQVMVFDGLKANTTLDSGSGLGMSLAAETSPAVLAEAEDNSPASVIPIGSRLTAIDSTPVVSWIDVLRVLRTHKAGDALAVTAEVPGAGAQKYTLALRESDVQFAQNLRFAPEVILAQRMILRKTTNPLEAAWWGVTETRDSVLQVYGTLRRLFQGSVPFKGLMGPVGLARVGTRVAAEGWDKLLWFMAIISANLAVVNFLPIPVVDGGHFLFLIIEKIQRKPVSAKTMEIAQYVGLAVILTVFVMVTYQDIMRFFVAH